MSHASPEPNENITLGDAANWVTLSDLLLTCETVSNKVRCEQLIMLLPKQIQNDVNQSDNPKIRALSLVQTCARFSRGVDKLVEQLYLLEQDSKGWQMVEHFLMPFAVNGRVVERAGGAKTPTVNQNGPRLRSWLEIPLNPLFREREGEFDRLEELLGLKVCNEVKESRFVRVGLVSSRTIGMVGMGGLGKTQLAVQLAHRYKEYFSTGHSSVVSSVAFSPDGNFVLTGSQDKTARLWRTKDGKLSRLLEGHKKAISSVAFSSDGRFILTGSEDKTARLWQVSASRFMHSAKGHSDTVRSVAFSPDGNLILTGSFDSKACLWKTSTKELLQSFHKYNYTITSVAFSPDGNFILTGSGDGTSCIWETYSGKLVHSLKTHILSVTSVAFSPDGNFILTGSGDKTARLWQVSDGKLLHSFEGHDYTVWSVAFSPDGKSILTGSGDNTARLWEAGSSKWLHSLKGHNYAVWSVAFSSDGNFVVTGSSDTTVHLWQAKNGRLLHCFKGQSSGVKKVAFSPDDKFILVGSDDNIVWLWKIDELNIGQLLAVYPLAYPLEAIHWRSHKELWLADSGGVRNYPNIYRLQLEGV